MPDGSPSAARVAQIDAELIKLRALLGEGLTGVLSARNLQGEIAALEQKLRQIQEMRGRSV